MTKDVIGVGIITIALISYMTWYSLQVDKMMYEADNKPCGVNISKALESGGLALD